MSLGAAHRAQSLTIEQIFALYGGGLYYDAAFRHSIKTSNSSDDGNVVNDGDTVGRWRDKLYGTNSLGSQSTAANRPTWKNQNGLQYLNFDGTNDAFSAGGGGTFMEDYLAGVGGFTVLAAFQADSPNTGAQQNIWGGVLSNSSSRFRIALTSAGYLEGTSRRILGTGSTQGTITGSNDLAGLAGVACLEVNLPSASARLTWNAAEYITTSSSYGTAGLNDTSTISSYSMSASPNFFKGKVFALGMIPRTLQPHHLFRLQQLFAAKAGKTL